MAKREPLLITIDPESKQKLSEIKHANGLSSLGKAVEFLIYQDQSKVIENIYTKIDILTKQNKILKNFLDKKMEFFIYKFGEVLEALASPGKTNFSEIYSNYGKKKKKSKKKKEDIEFLRDK